MSKEENDRFELIGKCGQFELASILIPKQLKIKFLDAVKKKHGFVHTAGGKEIQLALRMHIISIKNDLKIPLDPDENELLGLLPNNGKGENLNGRS